MSVPHTRRDFLRNIGLGALSAATAGAPAARAAEKPNVIIILTDDQGALDAGCYGAKDLYTPAMDRLAATGVRFTQAYSHTVCCPARAMLLTGRQPQRCNVNEWMQGRPGDDTRTDNMFLGEITIAEVLRDAGYATALCGKWHLGGDLAHGPEHQGFQQFFGFRGGFIDNYLHYYLHREGYHDLWENEREVFHKAEYFPELSTARALQFISENKEHPFFLYLAFNLPHYPEQADPQFDTRYESLPEPRRSYAKVVSTVDNRIGRVLDHLEALGLRNNTIVLFMSDNGYSAEDYQIKMDGHTSGLPQGTDYGPHGGGGYTGGWRGYKGTFFEGGLRVPCIVSYPALIPQGETYDGPIIGADWMPSILELCGVPLPEVTLDGRSLVPLLDEAKLPERVLHWQWQTKWAVRDGQWKLINDAGNKKLGEDTIFLGNLGDDPPEETNHAAEHPEIVERLTQLHEAWAKEVTPKSGE